MNPFSDNSTLWAISLAVAVFVSTLVVLQRLRSSAARKEAQQVARMSDSERAAAAAIRKREAELERAIAAGTHLPPVGAPVHDGRPRCQASVNCTEPATHAKPRIVRDEGMIDFVRRGFGAPRRYRMIEPTVSETTGLWGAIVGIFQAVFAILHAAWFGGGAETAATPPELKYCDVHVHIARQVCREQLAADEHAEMMAQSNREAALTYFESAGLEKRVLKVVGATEQSDSDKKPRSRKGAESEKGTVIPIGRSVSNGASVLS